MIHANILGISNEYIYNIFLTTPSLSAFLLNIYVSQLDLYIKKLCNSSNFNKFLCFKPYLLNIFYKRNLSIVKTFIPLKIGKSLINSYNLKKIRVSKQNKFSLLYKRNSSKVNFSFFFKHIYYVRYNEHILLGVIGSKNFSKFVSRKLQGFIRSNLHFDLLKYNLQYSSLETIFFLGFQIRMLSSNLKSQKKYFNTDLIMNKKYSLRIYSRLVIWKKKLASLTIDRFSFEFFGQVLSIIQNKDLNFSSLKDRRVWIYLFQLEAIRCFQTNKLINSKDRLNLISEESVKNLKFLNVNTYKNFSFNFYAKKIRVLLKSVIESFPSFITKSVTSLDIELSILFAEYKKKFHFLNDSFFYTVSTTDNLQSKTIKYLNNFFEKPEKKTKKNKYIVKKTFLMKRLFFFGCSKNLYLNSSFLISCSISYILLKFSGLGFINIKKKRPVSNLRFLMYEDKEIIQFFGSFSYSLLNWFRCSDNFSKVKFLVEIIRQSCFLTLCRKHNKRKTWAYSIYTPNLLLNSTIYENKSFFPTKKFLFSLQKFFLYNDIDFICSENFFKIF